MREVHAHIHDVASWTADQMLEIPGIRIFGDPNHPDSSGAVSFLHDSIQSQDLAILLDEGGFAVRTGHHCAQPLMRKFGVSATNRASFYLYNTMEEAENFTDTVEEIIERFG